MGPYDDHPLDTFLYDSNCKDLARYFLEGRVPDDVLDGMSSDLAQAIQGVVEDFDISDAAVVVKRALQK